MRKFVFLILYVLSGHLALAQTPFEGEIRAFERQDSLYPPVRGRILLYGSSTMRLWDTYAEDLKGFEVYNRGFGGSQMSDALYYFDRVVLPLAPSWILLYEGDNDLSNGNKTPQQVLADYKAFMKKVKRSFPQTRVAIYTLRPSLARESLMPRQRELNALFAAYCQKHPRRAYLIDAYDLLLKEGRPNPDYLAADKLHLNARGYEEWTRITRDFLSRHYAD